MRFELPNHTRFSSISAAMASTSVIAVCGPRISSGFRSSKGKMDFESSRISNNLCSRTCSGIGSLQFTFKHEERYKGKPWRLSADPSRKRACMIVRSQGIRRDNVLETTEKVQETGVVHELVIVGGGIAGLAAAAAMHKIGVKSLVLEQSPALRTTGSALNLWRNAWHVLDVLGVGDKLRSVHSPVTGVRLFNQQGDLLRSFDLGECPGGPHELYGVERKVLVETLASLLPTGTIHFNARVVLINRETEVGPLVLTLSDGSVIRTKILLGADGVNSVVGKWMGLGQTRFVGHIGVRGLALYPNGHSYGDSIRQYCGAGSRAGITPISPTKVYWFFAYNKSAPGPKVTDPNDVKEELLGFIDNWPEYMRDLLEHTPLENLSRAALSDRWSLPGTPPVVQNGVTLAGDALHPMTPNLGQGGGCALEDSIVLARTLGAVLAAQGTNADHESITKAMEEYAAERRQRTLPLTVRSFIMGGLLMISFPPVVFVRDKLAIPKIVGPGSFLNHTLYNPGQLPVTQAARK